MFSWFVCLRGLLVRLFVGLSVHVSASLCVCLFVCLFVGLFCECEGGGQLVCWLVGWLGVCVCVA